MKLRTTDPHVEQATNKFFEDLGLEQSALKYFDCATVKKKLSEGYSLYKKLLEEALKSANKDAEDMAKEVTEKLTITEEEYIKNAYETFKEKIADIFHAASSYIDIKPQLIALFQKEDSEDLLLLVITSMNDFIEVIANRFKNLIVLLIEGVPMEVAEQIVEEAEDAEIIPIGVHIGCVDEEDEDENSEKKDEKEHHCTC